MAIVFNVAQLELYFASEDDQGRGHSNENDVANLIVKAFDDGNILTRKRAKEAFAANMGDRPFSRAWQKAAEQRPQLSLPGRRSGIMT